MSDAEADELEWQTHKRRIDSRLEARSRCPCRAGLNYAPDQAKGYASHFPNCRVVAVSNGYCYKVYERVRSGRFSQDPRAYLNLLRPRNRYPLDPDNVDGCLETLKMLLPSS